MKVTFIAEHYPPDPGGVATSSKRIAESVALCGHDVQVLTFDNSRPLVSDDYVKRLVEQHVSISRIGPFFLRHPDLDVTPISEKHRAMFRRRACRQMVREASTFEPDIVVSFYLLNAGFLSRFVASEVGVPCIVGVRGNDVGLNVFHVERFAAVRWTLEGAARIVCVNEHLKRRTLSVSPELKARTVVIPNGVAVPVEPYERALSRDAICSATGWSDDVLIAVFIGTLREKKGIVTLLKALDRVQETAPVRLLVVGPDIGNVERHLCGELWDTLQSSGAIYCTGQVSRAEVPRWAAGADVVVMPSLDDGLANGLLEGMALGLCPVASLIFEDVLREDIGILFDQSSVQQLADVLRALASDRPLVKRLGLAARDYVTSHHQSDREAKEYLQVIESALIDFGDPR